MKTFTLSLLLSILYYAAGAQCTAPFITASGSTTLCPGGSITLSAPASNVWTRKANFGGASRGDATGFSIGSKGYIGTGFGSGATKDFWEYNPVANTWTQKADFGGEARSGATGFSIGTKGYIGTGFSNSSTTKDFWEFDPATNVWTRKADFGGTARANATGFSIGSKGYIGTGTDVGYTKDFWEYDPATDKWAQKADFGGTARANATGFSISSKGYIGTGLGYSGDVTKDFWEYDPATDKWAQKADFGGTARANATGFSISSKGYIGTGFGSGATKDFWEYDPFANTWTQKADFGGALRANATGFSIGSKGYIGAGFSSSDFWEYDPGYTYLWSPGGQTTSSITATAAGNYTVTTTNAAGCTATSATTIVTVNTPTTPVVTPSGPTTFCPGGSVTLSAPVSNVWTRKADFGGIARQIAVSFSIGSKGYIGTGSNSNDVSLKDFWEYNPATGVWTQKADFGGAARVGAVGFSIGSKGYIGTGGDVIASINFKDFWEYDPAANAWTQKADFGGGVREYAVGFSIGSKGYLGTGLGGNNVYKDFWEYDPATDKWTQKTDFGGVARNYATGISIGSKGYIGTGFNNGSYLKDFWEYNPATDVWTKKTDFGGVGRIWATGFSIGSKGYIGTGLNNSGFIIYKDFWEYNPATDAWTQKADLGGTARYSATGFSIGSKGYMGTGNDFGSNFPNDFWEYTPDYTYSWSPGGQTTSSISATTTGNYTVTTTNAIGCSAASAATVVTVNTPVTPVITASGSTTFCPGSSVTLTSSSATTYQWYLNNTPISGATSQSYIASGAGNYTVTTTNATGCSATSAAIAVTVNAVPATPVITASGSTALCSGSSVTLTSSVTGATYQWYLNGAAISGAVSQSYTASAFGGYTVSVTNASGCSAISAPRTVTVNTIDKPSVTASGATALCSGGSVTLSAPFTNVWTQKTDFGGTARLGAAGFAIGSKGYIGTGYTGSSYLKDFWQYDPATNVWTQEADFGGSARIGTVGFSIGNKGYIGIGRDPFGYKKDFWEYDPAANAWTQKTDFGGTGRESAVGFSNGSNGYVGTGYDGSYKKDFWEYNPSTNVWTQKTDFGGTARLGAAGFAIGSKGYIGTGNAGSNTKDFWEYDPAANAWTQKTDFGGTARYVASNFSIGSKGYIGTGYDGISENDLWEYNQPTNSWAQKTAFPGAGRLNAVGFSIGSKGYIGTGQLSNNSPAKDIYEYDPGYIYSWSTGATTSSINLNTTGNYTVTTTNALDCSATSVATKVSIYPAGTVYVDSSKATSGDGSSWANAYKELRDALYAASQCSSIATINVAKGTYKPTGDANRDSAFTVYRGGLKIYGGYPSGGGTRNSAANLTILSGDIGTANNTSDNSYHVVVVAGVANGADSLVLDGFNVSGGNANRTGNTTYNGASLYQGDGAGVYLANNGTGGKTAIRNCIVTNNFANNNGGGIYNQSSSPVIINCVLASNSGGGMYNGFSSPSVTNCVFVSNSAVGNGGAMVNINSSPVVVNCTFALNTATGNGTIFSQNPSSPQFTNCIIWGNTASAGNVGFQNTISTPSVTYSDVEGGYGGTGNISSDPLFVNSSDADGADNIFGSADDGLKLRLGSPAGSTGNNASIPAGITTDITGAARIQNGTVDMGAYESPSCPSSQTLYVDGSKATSGDGTSWANAYKELRDALYIAGQCSNVTTINVAKGTYKPIDYANPDSAFVIYRGGLKMYGGYPTGGGARNPGVNPTILSGEIGTSATTDNSYHIMVIAGLPGTADSVVIDGFTFTAGNATGTGSALYNGVSLTRDHGAAIDAEQNASGKLAFRNLIIANNAGGSNWGAALVLTGSNATLDKCIFYGNSTSGTGQGGAMWNNNSTTTMTNCLLYNNYGAGLGGAIQLNGSNPLTIINSTFYANRTAGNGGAIRSGSGSVLNLSNTIFYKNDIGAQNGTYAAPGNDVTLVGSYTITNSLMQGAAAGYLNTANSVFGDNPLFVNEANPAGADGIFGTADDGFHLQAGSPAQNGGNNASVPSGITTDLANAARIQDGIVDMGAYEGSSCSSFATLYVDSSITTSGNGGSWATAFRTLQQALNVANSCPVVKSVWIKKGTYYPAFYPFNCTDCATNSTARDYTFALRDGLALYGGFAGTETDTAQRVAGNTTILSGDIGTPNDNSDNCYHVLFAINSSNKLSGLTVTGGNANNNGTITVAGQTIYRSNGGGIYQYTSSASLYNCTFSNNTAISEGGGVYNVYGSALWINKSGFLNNHSGSGGAVRLLFGNASFISLSSVYSGNTASSNDGGALSLVTGYGKDTLINNLFVQNKAFGSTADNGGGALVQESGTSSYIVNNTFYADSAASNGGAIRFKSGGSNRYLYNNIFYKSYNGTSNTDVSVESGTTITAQSNNLYSSTNPLFINEASPAGSDNLFGTSDDGLRLQIGSPAQNTGSNAAIPTGITTDIKGDARISNCTVDMGAYEVIDNANLYWTGLVSNDWQTAGNWCGGVPAPAASVVIPVSAPYPPRLSSPGTVNNLMIATGTSLSLNGNTLTLAGTVSGTGVITGSPSSNIVINGSGDAGTLYFDPSADGTTNALSNMTVNRTSSGTVTLGNKLNLTGAYTPSAGVLNSNGYLTLKSNATGTASVGTGSSAGGYIMGNVMAERYTDGGAPGVGRRAWRLLSSPVTGSTIYDDWQESGITTNGYGTLITGEGLTPAQASAEGFDYVGGGNHTSIKQYDSIGNAWVPLSTNNTTGTRIPIRSHLAYMVFVRGDRTVNSTTGKSPATLRALGTLLQGTQTVALSPGSFTLAGNPYPSPLDFGSLYSHNSTLLQNQFSVWNSTLGVYGAYVLVKRNAANTAYEATPAPMNVSRPDDYKYIPGGAGFFLYPLAGVTSGNVTIGETDKASGTPPVSPFREVSPAVKELRVNLNLKDNDTSVTLADGFLVQFDDAFADTAAQKDASGIKAANFNENLAVVRSGTNFIVDARQNVQSSDTVFMKLWYVSKRAYRFQVKADNFSDSPGMQAWLEDSYLGTKQALSLSGDITTIDFTVTNDSLSWQSNRFRIVFRNQALTSLPVTLTHITAAPQNSGVNVSWTVSNEVNIKGYTVERSADGGRTYADIAVQPATSGGNSASYSSFDAKPNKGDNLYRIRIEANDAAVSYSGSVNVTIGERPGIAIAVYPNPATTRATVHIDNLTDDMSIMLTDDKGDIVWRKDNVTTTDTSIPVAHFANGSYLITIKTKNGIIKTTKLVKAD